jgi:membrane protein involved in colicin uptake
MERFDRIPEKIKDKIFQKVFKIAEFHNMSKTDQQVYEDSLKYYRDLKNSLDTAELDGFAKAEQLFLLQLKKAKMKEEEERRQKEEAKLREEEAILREKEAMFKLALKMKKYGESVADIIKETGLSAKEISNLE